MIERQDGILVGNQLDFAELVGADRSTVQRGFDPESVMREIANDNRVADAAGLTFDSDSRVAAPGAGATQTPTPTRAMQVDKIVLRDPVTQRIVSIKEIHTPLNGAPGGGVERRTTTRDATGRITNLGDDGGLT